MRVFVLIVVAGALISSAACRRAEPPVAAAAIESSDQGRYTGVVAETMNAGGYTYVRLQAPGKDDVWVAAGEFKTAVGDQLSVTLEMPMANFESKTLNRTFPTIYFVQSVSRGGETVETAGPASPGPQPMEMMTSRTPGTTPAAPAASEPVAPPAGGLSIADLWAQRKALSGKDVVIRGRVVKANNAIMGVNWLHLQDGSGSESERTHDITVTTDAVVKVGEVVTLKGVLATAKDFGSGYAYDAIIEKAVLVK